MARRRPLDPKSHVLRQSGALNPHPEKVEDPLFEQGDFFDARDVVQVKYEMLRRVQVEGHPIASTAASFGFSRPSFYQAQAALQEGGLSALLPRKRGPHGAHKLCGVVLKFIAEARASDAALSSTALATLVKERFGITVHVRSIERALTREKKTPPAGPTR
jgi:transposase